MIARELLAYSRQPWTYWLRLLSAFGVVSILAIMATTGRNRLGQADGHSLFAGSAVILFLIASLNGLRSTSDCIASERREGTLVLLFLASLKLHTILVSKLITNSLRNAWALLGTLPVLGVCLLLGGVSGSQFVQGMLAILAAAWLSLMVGLDQSCRNQGEHEAFSHGLRRLVLLNLLPFVSPASLMLNALGVFPSLKIYFWMTLGGTVLAGLHHWSRAKRALADNWQEPPREEAPVPSGQRTPELRPVTGHLKKPPRLCGNTPPAHWLFARYGDARQVTPFAIGISFVATAAFVLLVNDSMLMMVFYPWVMGAGRLIQMLAMAKIAPQSFAEITRPGALEILQTTPVTLRQIVRAAYDFLITHFRRGVLPMLGLDAAVLLLLALKKESGEGSTWGFAGLLLAQNSLFLSGLFAMGVTGIWLGLRQRSLLRASFSACFYFLVLPASFYVLWPASAARTTVALVIAYCGITLLMRIKLSRLVQSDQSLLRHVR